MNLFKLIVFILLFLTKICAGAVHQMDLAPISSRQMDLEAISSQRTEDSKSAETPKPIDGLRILQPVDIQNFMKFIGCDINALWDDCFDVLSEEEKGQIYTSKILAAKLLTQISELKIKISKAFYKCMSSVDAHEINNQNLNAFLEKYKLRNCKISKLHPLSLEYSTLVADDIKPIRKYAIRIPNPNNFDLLMAIKNTILSYFDDKFLAERLADGDETIFDAPTAPVLLQFYEDNSLEVYGLPGMRQDLILTEHIIFEENKSSIGIKALSPLLVISEFAAIVTSPLYQATVAAMRANAHQEQAEKTVQQKNQYWAFKTLELNSRSTPLEIRAQYKELSRKFHPDKLSGNAERFMEIVKAYEILKK
jgi:hypothetical protein